MYERNGYIPLLTIQELKKKKKINELNVAFSFEENKHLQLVSSVVSWCHGFSCESYFFFLVAGMVLCLGFRMRIMLITRWCVSCCWVFLTLSLLTLFSPKLVQETVLLSNTATIPKTFQNMQFFLVGKKKKERRKREGRERGRKRMNKGTSSILKKLSTVCEFIETSKDS